MLEVSPVTAHGVALDGPDVVVSSYHRTGKTLDHDRESAGRNIEVAGLEPDSVRVGNPQPLVFQADAGDEVFTAPLVVVEAVGEAGKAGNRHVFPLLAGLPVLAVRSAVVCAGAGRDCWKPIHG